MWKWLLGVLLIAAAAAQVRPSGERARVEGIVTTQAGQPVPRALLQLNPAVGPSSTARQIAVTADDAGKFVFDDVPADRYILSATKAGFLTARYGQRTVTGPGLVLVLGPGGLMTDAFIKLTAQSVISGQVLDQDGDPVPSAQVGLLRSSYLNGRRQMSALSPVQIRTDDRGSFRISGLNPGRYYLRARPMSDTPSLQGYTTTFYPNTNDVSSAAPIDVQAGSDVKGIDVRMRRETAYSVKGVTVPAARLAVDRIEAGGLSGSEAPVFVTADADGAFEVRNLRPGTYVAQIAPNAAIPALEGLSGRVEFTVTDSDLRGVVLELAPPVQFSGIVKLENGDLENLPVTNRRIGLQLLAAGLGIAASDLTVNVDGTIAPQPVPANKYLWDIHGLPDGLYVKSARLANQEVSRTALEVAPGGRIEIMLANNAAAIGGLVQNEGHLVVGFPVTVWPKTPHPGGIHAGILNTVTDQNGAFRISGLAPGDYFAAAWEEIDPSVAEYPAFLALFAGDAAPVKLVEGGQQNVSLTLISTERIARELAKVP